jgi:hypothetical protein
MSAALVNGLWPLGALLELPRDMHCDHELPAAGLPARAAAQCPECQRVREVMEALRNERPA